MNSGHETLPEPEVFETRDASGKLASVHIRIRTGRAVRAVQPNHAKYVFFEVGSDDLPVVITLLEPVRGLAMTFIGSYLYPDKDGSPGGIGRRVRHVFLTDEQIERLYDRVGDAATLLEEAAA